MPHQPHGDLERHARLGEARAEGVPQGMEVDPAALAVRMSDPSSHQVSAEGVV
ncbi:MAG: hypothetical protein NXI14_00345 [bacterium]|nr:hypothetical protein [bacterium]